MVKNDNLEELAGKYPLLRKVIDGDTTLWEMLETYEKNLSSVADRIMSLKSLFGLTLSADIDRIGQEVDELIQLAEEFGYTNWDFKKFDVVEYSGSKYIKDNESWYVRERVRIAELYLEKCVRTFLNLGDITKELDLTILIRHVSRYVKEKPDFVKKVYMEIGSKEQEKLQEKLGEMLDLGALDISRSELEKFMNEINSESGKDG